MTKENLVAPVSVFFLWTRLHDERSCRSSFCAVFMDKIPFRKRILSFQFLCCFYGQDSIPKENLFAPVSVFVLWTRLHDERESCRSSVCVLSVDKTTWRKRILSLQCLCSFCGQDYVTKENLFAPVSVFFLWTRVRDERESCRSSVCALSVDKTPWRKISSLQFLCCFYGQDSIPKENLVAPVCCVRSVDKTPWRNGIVSLRFSSTTWDPSTQLHLSLHLPRYPLGCCIDDGGRDLLAENVTTLIVLQEYHMV